MPLGLITRDDLDRQLSVLEGSTIQESAGTIGLTLDLDSKEMEAFQAMAFFCQNASPNTPAAIFECGVMGFILGYRLANEHSLQSSFPNSLEG